MMTTTQTSDSETSKTDAASLLPTFETFDKLWIAYVYDYDGQLVRWRVFTSDLDATAWARRKSEKLGRTLPREIMQPSTPTPWSVRVYSQP